MEINDVMKAMGSIEQKLEALATKAEAEGKVAGSVSAETKAALDKVSQSQLEMAQRLAAIEQKATPGPREENAVQSVGDQFVKHALFAEYVEGNRKALAVQVKNTNLTSDTTVAPDRRPGVVGGAFRQLKVEASLNAASTTSNAVEFTRENVFTNNAAEQTEGAAKAETDITFTLATAPVRTVAHFTKISRQLAQDAPALAAYINRRMVFGVDLKVENQLVNGPGTGVTIGGLLATGNFTPHGYSAASMTAWLSGYTRLDLIRRVYADCQVADFGANAIIVNPLDWAIIEVLKDSQGRYIVGNPQSGAPPALWGVPVIATPAMPSDNFLIGALDMAATVYNREGTAIALSEEDGTNFIQNLVTIRAERRVALAAERPAAIRAGDLTPA